MGARLQQANMLVAEYFLTEMDESGLSAEEQVQGLMRELRISRDEAIGCREAWGGDGRARSASTAAGRHAERRD